VRGTLCINIAALAEIHRIMDSLHRVRRSTLARSLRARRFPNSVGERKRKERAASSAMKKLRIAYGILRCSPKALRVTRARCRVRATSNSGEFRWRTRGRNGRRARAPVWSLSSPGETRSAYARRNRGHACMHMHPSSLPSHPPPPPPVAPTRRIANSMHGNHVVDVRVKQHMPRSSP